MQKLSKVQEKKEKFCFVPTDEMENINQFHVYIYSSLNSFSTNAIVLYGKNVNLQQLLHFQRKKIHLNLTNQIYSNSGFKLPLLLCLSVREKDGESE